MKSLGVMMWIGVLAGCVEEGSPHPIQHLPSDGHYVAVPAGYTTPEDCIAHEAQPFSCIDSLSLCTDGRAGRRLGDIVMTGTYTVDNAVAAITFRGGSDMAFDLDAVEDLDAPIEHWIVDTEQRWNTLQFDNIDCAMP